MARIVQQFDYRIRIEGCIDESLVDWSGPVWIASRTEPGARTMTTLTGSVADQSALVGLIRRLHGLGVVLLTVERVEK
jgi:hypothetical protein